MNLWQHQLSESRSLATRRHFLKQGVAGLGACWLAAEGLSLPAAASSAGAIQVDPTNPWAPRAPHFSPRAKRVIFLHMAGAPSQFELFDYKPELARLDGQPCPASLIAGERFAFIRGVPKLLGPNYPFHQVGETGRWISDRLPHLERVIDRLCFVHTMQTDQFNHAPAQLLVHTGSPRGGGASFGSWTTYGLGSENQNLPGFIVLLSGGKNPSVGQAGWGSGFLPSVYQGVQCRSEGDPVLFLSNPDGIDATLRRRVVEAINRVNQETHAEMGDPETVTRIAQYEMACRMQLEATTAMNLSEETAQTLALYNAEPGAESFANNCLLARRLVERGVRFVQLFDWGWDMHGTSDTTDLGGGFAKKTREIDQPIAALLEDLERRGLLDETLVVWAGEFGRTPMAENRGGKANPFLGRDHHAKAFTLWMAGGGVKAGYSHGETDPVGYGPITAPVQVRDLHATLLRLLGFDNERLVFPARGLDQRLTGVEKAHVVEELLA
ncbi:DUF1501 domain-containing protein [Botrimarina hoheduenensis]|uniref:Sulfatase n=1 Tax=Botrimarina hoheduenensis TaxID=2528000 RepID=A0A5C5W0N0_9BACT|nr:DUF1501 domain-containing protein [Botrimarina hoheduenensis]TWT43332.1 hypothetical protein Pla111_22830 [Botrimarina hoheduenensis]